MAINFFKGTNPSEQSDLFSDNIEIPTEKNPFCNNTEISSYNEEYSHIIPGFFFRNTKCSVRPLRYEKSKLRYFYNTAGILLISKVFIFISLFIFITLFALFCSYSETLSSHSFLYLIMNNSVRYGAATISSIITTIIICGLGCRFSELSLSDLFRSNHNSRTSEIIYFFMTGMFISSLYNIISLLSSGISGIDFAHTIKYTPDIKQILIIFIYNCIIVPVCDGLIYRGIVLKNLSRASQRFGIFVSAFLCALSSGNIINIVPYFLLSVLFSKMTIKYNTIIPSIIIHIVINICNTIINIYKDIFCNSDIFISRLWTIITFTSSILFAAYCVIKETSPKNTVQQKKRTLPVFLSCPSFIMLIVIYAVIITADMLTSLI